jgi:hypothetical protein
LGGGYGGGGGGGITCRTNPNCRGADGLIVITYIPVGHRIKGNVKIRGLIKFR